VIGVILSEAKNRAIRQILRIALDDRRYRQLKCGLGKLAAVNARCHVRASRCAD
jgi:hypothetical protein